MRPVFNVLECIVLGNTMSECIVLLCIGMANDVGNVMTHDRVITDEQTRGQTRGQIYVTILGVGESEGII